jgi:lipoprotein-anchoring transpeptidase ErfK/SrfK
MSKWFASASLAALIAAFAIPTSAQAQSALAFFNLQSPFARLPPQITAPPAVAPSDDEEDGSVAARFQRQIVEYPSREAPGTIIVDTPNTYLYYILGGGRAIRYGIGVGREGFTWSGVKSITRKAEWPDWYPPPEMIGRQPYLPRMMAGGPGNPLGARALYIGGTEYRIHGTNAPSTIGKHVSSGCIRLRNADVIDLFKRVQIGAKVVVLPQRGMHDEARVSRGPSSVYRVQ